jgi:hypothetical protein
LIGVIKRTICTKVLAAVVITVAAVSAFAILGGPKRGLRSEVTVENADMGIPGISKVYEARLFNRGFWPIKVHYCDFVSDTDTPGTMVAYGVEQWDNAIGSWKVVARSTGVDFCKPYPTSMGQTKVKSRLLWPGQSIATGEEATAARGFSIGDRARFVIFPNATEDTSYAVATPAFIIDEQMTTNEPLRIRH